LSGLIERFKRATAKAAGASEAPEPAPTRGVLFVCMGNICRSPTAEGVFRAILAAKAPDLRVVIDSAGTHGYHVGQPPDPRACRAAERRGIDLTLQRARQVTAQDFARFDLVLAMDQENRALLQGLSPPQYHERIRLLMEFAPQAGREDVPDPYYGGSNGFEYVLDLVEQASLGLIEHLRRTLPPKP
jgi:protein-tyrosine phosphatase